MPRESNTVVLPIERTIPINSRSDAINAVFRFTPEELLFVNNDDRVPLVKYLIERLTEYMVSIPPIWTAIVLDPMKYNIMSDDINSGHYVFQQDLVDGLDSSYFDHRPTIEAERAYREIQIELEVAVA